MLKRASHTGSSAKKVSASVEQLPVWHIQTILPEERCRFEVQLMKYE